MPTTTSTIGGNTFPWAQLDHRNNHFITGQNLVSQFQTVYKRENIVGSGRQFLNGAFSAKHHNLLHFRTRGKPKRYDQ